MCVSVGVVLGTTAKSARFGYMSSLGGVGGAGHG